MFFKFYLHDLRGGILAEYKKYIFAFVVMMTFSLTHFLKTRILQMSNPQYFTNKPTIGDYILNIIFGVGERKTDVESMIFQMPIIWLTAVLIILFLTLYYPYNDLMGQGKHLLILSGSRGVWWLSKCLWVIMNVMLYFALFALSLVLSALLYGVEWSLLISTYLPGHLGIASNALAPSPWDLRGILLLCFLAVSAMCLLQLFLSLLIRPLFSFIVMSGYVLACTYFSSYFCLGSGMMAAKNDIFIRDGLNTMVMILISLWVMAASVIVGYIVFHRADILNKE